MHQFNDPRRIPVSLPDDGPMRPKHAAGNKYEFVKYRLIVVATANLTIYELTLHCEQKRILSNITYLCS
jgi:hypothetical protein